MKQVYICRKIPVIAQEILESAGYQVTVNSDEYVLTEQDLCNAVKKYDCLLTTVTEQISSKIIGAATRTKLISNYAVGLNNIDVEAAKAAGIKITNLPHVTTESTADIAFTLILMLARRIPEAIGHVKEGHYKRWEPSLFKGSELRGKTLGIIGMGRIGQAVSKRALSFGMNVCFTNRSPKQLPGDLASCKSVSLVECLENSDFVSIHVPLTDKTNELIGNRELKFMSKKQGVIINTARGEIINSNALENALEDGWIGGAGLDVFAPLPLQKNHPLLKYPNCIVLPHIGSATVDCRNEMARIAAQNIIDEEK